ncbi:MAG: aspartate-alanine antiporter, partial [Duncaniella sp.]|nr:aspartate-alanine antiporter [Duncaniella sp.]
MQTIVTFMQAHPLIAVFLTVGLGFWLGRIRLGSFSFGPVAATLVVGIVVGQMKLVIPDIFKTVFFLFFLFSIGYSVGPQFFRSFRGSGVRQAIFAVVMALLCAATVIAAARLMGYNNGIAAGLYAGSQTVSACLGLLGDTVREMPLDPDRRDYLLMIIPACYAVTYLFGTVGSAWYLSVIGPRFMGGLEKVKEATAVIEQQMDGAPGQTSLTPGQIKAGRPVEFRAYTAESDFFSSPKNVTEIEALFASKDLRVIVERVRKGDSLLEPSSDTPIARGDTVVLGGRSEMLVGIEGVIGHEVADPQLLNFAAQRTRVTVSSKGGAGMTLAQIRSNKWMDGIVIASISRNGHSIPVRSQTQIEAADVVTIVGFPRDVAEAAAHIGYADNDSNVTDMVFVGLGIAFGCLLGSLAIKVKGIPLSLGLSGGTLIAGLLLGWLRSRRPSFGHIPSSVLWIFSNLGLNMFIAV